MEKLQKNSFHNLINGDKPILVDFSAEWCGPCKMMAPILSELSRNMTDTIRIIKIDIDKNPRVASRYNIQSVPTLMLFQNGIIKWRKSGVLSANNIAQEIKMHLTKT